MSSASACFSKRLTVEVSQCLEDAGALSDFSLPPSPPANRNGDNTNNTNIRSVKFSPVWDQLPSPSTMQAMASPQPSEVLPCPFEFIAKGPSASTTTGLCVSPFAVAAGRSRSGRGAAAVSVYGCCLYSPRQEAPSSAGGSSSSSQHFNNSLFNAYGIGSDGDESGDDWCSEGEEPSSPSAASASPSPKPAGPCCATRMVSFSSYASARYCAASSTRASSAPRPQQQPQLPCGCDCRCSYSTQQQVAATSGRGAAASPADDGCGCGCCCGCGWSPRTKAWVAAAFARHDWGLWAAEPEWAALRDAPMSTLERFGLIHWSLQDLHQAQMVEAFASQDWDAVFATAQPAEVEVTSEEVEEEEEMEEEVVDYALLREAADEAVLALLSPVAPCSGRSSSGNGSSSSGSSSGYQLSAEDVVLLCADMADLEASGLVDWTPKRLALDTAFRRLVLEAEQEEEQEGAASETDSCCSSGYSRCSSGRSSSNSNSSGNSRRGAACWWLADEEEEAVRALVFGGGAEEEEGDKAQAC
ncbi:hypothetical protein HYH02_005492 [Chlamydomonas schloesseri]|uniref:Uncharacterized protein n=1 Tax=Chlamydomonas schloesseri TaxID=2026947 RepID=A0A835WKN0_9CHLO|nr:hypothetical protein HYH02_005492 [Chlamydomonas schloesseri]|eukprot:KAG2449337.1 hypothetical protein HYH02_005492 [Chlamydomonas schloesseri]